MQRLSPSLFAHTATVLMAMTLVWPNTSSAQGTGLRWQWPTQEHGHFSLTARLAPVDQPLLIRPLWMVETPLSHSLRLRDQQALNLHMKWDWRLSAAWDFTSTLGVNYSLTDSNSGLSLTRPASAGGYFGLQYRF